jgi:hypothetical protein
MCIVQSAVLNEYKIKDESKGIAPNLPPSLKWLLIRICGRKGCDEMGLKKGGEVFSE